MKKSMYLRQTQELTHAAAMLVLQRAIANYDMLLAATGLTICEAQRL